MPIPTCECVRGLTFAEKLMAIYCAALEVNIPCVTPTLLSATVDGESITLVFDEEVTGTGAGFTAFLDGDDSTLGYVSGEGTTTLVFSLNVGASEGETVTLDYSAGAGDVTAGNCPLFSFTDFPVTNNTGLQFVYLRPGGVDGYFRPGGVDTYIRP